MAAGCGGQDIKDPYGINLRSDPSPWCGARAAGPQWWSRRLPQPNPTRVCGLMLFSENVAVMGPNSFRNPPPKNRLPVAAQTKGTLTSILTLITPSVHPIHSPNSPNSSTTPVTHPSHPPQSPTPVTHPKHPLPLSNHSPTTLGVRPGGWGRTVVGVRR